MLYFSDAGHLRFLEDLWFFCRKVINQNHKVALKFPQPLGEGQSEGNLPLDSTIVNRFNTRLRKFSKPTRTSQRYAQIAQSVEQGIENPRVGGSIPPLGTTSFQ